MIIGQTCGEDKGRYKMGLLRVVAEVLGQAVKDAAEGIACGVLNEEMMVVRKAAPIPRCHSESATEMDCVDAAVFFLDGRAAQLCDVLGCLAPRSAVSVGFLRRRAVLWSKLPKRERGVDHGHGILRMEEERWEGDDGQAGRLTPAVRPEA